MCSNSKKTCMIVAGSIGGAVLLGAMAYAVWNCKKMRTMRAIHRTNAVVRRVGNVLCKIAATDEACG